MDRLQARFEELGDITKELVQSAPQALAAGLTDEQANRLYIALVRHAEAVDELLDDLDEADANPHLIEAAGPCRRYRASSARICIFICGFGRLAWSTVPAPYVAIAHLFLV